MTKNGLYNVAVVGATGAVGQKILKILEDKHFPIKQLKPLSSARSAGKKIQFKNEEITIEEATPESIKEIDNAIFSYGGSITEKLVAHAVKNGEIVIDHTCS